MLTAKNTDSKPISQGCMVLVAGAAAVVGTVAGAGGVGVAAVASTGTVPGRGSSRCSGRPTSRCSVAQPRQAPSTA